MTQIYLNGRFAVQPVSGVQRFALEMTAELQNLLGGHLRIICPQGGQQVFKDAQEAGKRQGHKWEQFDLPRAAAGGFLINLGNTAPLLCRRQITVIHDAGVFEVPEAYGKRFRAWYKTMQYWLCRNGTKIVTISASSRAGIAKHLGISEQNIPVIPEGADHFDRITPDREFLVKWALRPGSFVLAVGNLAAHKNLSALSPLARMLAGRGMQLVIAGNLKGAAFAGGGPSSLPQPALYVGRVSDEALKALFEAASCYVFPSLYEGYGLPAVEAMRCGCPVVAADIPGLRESCGDAALYCDPHSPGDIACKISHLLDDNSLRQTMASRGLNHTGGLTWRRAAQSLAGIIEDSLSNQRAYVFGRRENFLEF